MLFADVFQDLALMCFLFCFGLGMLFRWVARSGAASSVATAAGKGLIEKTLEAIFKKR